MTALLWVPPFRLALFSRACEACTVPLVGRQRRFCSDTCANRVYQRERRDSQRVDRAVSAFVEIGLSDRVQLWSGFGVDWVDDDVEQIFAEDQHRRSKP